MTRLERVRGTVQRSFLRWTSILKSSNKTHSEAISACRSRSVGEQMQSCSCQQIDMFSRFGAHDRSLKTRTPGRLRVRENGLSEQTPRFRDATPQVTTLREPWYAS